MEPAQLLPIPTACGALVLRSFSLPAGLLLHIRLPTCLGPLGYGLGLSLL